MSEKKLSQTQYRLDNIEKPVSLIFQEYTEPIIVDWARTEPKLTLLELNKMVEVPRSIWNAVTYDASDQKAPEIDLLGEMRRKVQGTPHSEFIEWWIERKREAFGEYHFLFGKVEFTEIDSVPKCSAEARACP